MPPPTPRPPTQQAFDAAMDRAFAQGLRGDALAHAFAEQFPGLTVGQFQALLTAGQALLQAKRDQLTDEAEVMTLVAGIAADHPAVSVGEAVARAAAQGDSIAIAIHQQFDSPAFRLQRALMEAAVEAHPDWSKTPEGCYRHSQPKGAGPTDPVGTPDALVTWFVDTYPSEAAEICARVTGSMLPDVASLRPG